MDKALLEKAIQEFNDGRSPEATAKLFEFNPSSIVVEFGGTTCNSCGFEEHFKDLEIFLADRLKSEFKITKIDRPRPDQYFVSYAL